MVRWLRYLKLPVWIWRCLDQRVFFTGEAIFFGVVLITTVGVPSSVVGVLVAYLLATLDSLLVGVVGVGWVALQFAPSFVPEAVVGKVEQFLLSHLLLILLFLGLHRLILGGVAEYLFRYDLEPLLARRWLFPPLNFCDLLRR